MIAVVVVLVAGAGSEWAQPTPGAAPRHATEARSLPQEVLAAEAALALPGVVALVQLDVRRAVAAEREMLGAEDSAALEGGQSAALLGRLRAAGIDLRRDLRHLVAGAVLRAKEPEFAAVALGKFSADAIHQALRDAYRTQPSSANGHRGLLVSSQDVETCKESGPYAVYAMPHRVVFGSPALVATVLDRLAAGTAAAVSLDSWRSFRKDNLFSAGVFMPGEVPKAVTDPMARVMLAGVQDTFNQMRAVYAGATAGGRHGAALSMLAESDGSEWARQTAERWHTWLASADAGWRETNPHLAALLGRIAVRAQRRELHADVDLGGSPVSEIGAAVSEALTVALSRMFQVQTPSAARGEKTLDSGDIAFFRDRYPIDAIPPFDAARSHGFGPRVSAGPFGVKVAALRLVAGSPPPIEVEVRADGDGIHNLGGSNMWDADSRGAWLFVDAVESPDGQNLLREEACGKDRNGAGSKLRVSRSTSYLRGRPEPSITISGEKAVRLQPGMSEVGGGRIRGHVRLTLPVRVRRQRLRPPLSGKVVERADVRVRFAAGDARSVSFEVSGSPARLLDVRALNADGRHLASDGGSATPRLFGAGSAVRLRFRGKVSSVEVVLAEQVETRDFPFVLRGLFPAFSDWERSAEVHVPTMDARTFTTRYRVPVAEKDVDWRTGGRASAGPFRMAVHWASANWFGVQASGELRAPFCPALNENLSAVELHFDRILIERSTEKKERVEAKLSDFVVLSGSEREKRLRGTISMSARDAEVGEGKLLAMRGEIVARLPLELAALRVPARHLGDSARAAVGLSATVREFGKNSVILRLHGGRERLVQVLAYDAAGRFVGPSSTWIQAVNEVGDYDLDLSVAARPHHMDLIYALRQDTLRYPFMIQIPAPAR